MSKRKISLEIKVASNCCSEFRFQVSKLSGVRNFRVFFRLLVEAHEAHSLRCEISHSSFLQSRVDLIPKINYSTRNKISDKNGHLGHFPFVSLQRIIHELTDHVAVEAGRREGVQVAELCVEDEGQKRSQIPSPKKKRQTAN